MKSPYGTLFDLSAQSFRLGMEASEVIGLRMIKAACGGAAAEREATLMITEKAQAALDAQFLIAQSVLTGKGHLAPGRAVALYRRRVQANRRRLKRRS
jgi:hypothetical protein